MRVYVEYSAPVLVEVDLEDESVLAVRVDDEQVDGPKAATSSEGAILSEGAASRAIAVAEGGSWPAWEFGL